MVRQFTGQSSEAKDGQLMAGSIWTDEELENWQRRVARLSPDAPAGLSREDALALFRELERNFDGR